MSEIVQRLTPSKETLNKLFAVSGNECGFPECKHPLFDEEFEFVAEICHIEAAMPGGERFNDKMTNEDRRSLANLVALCHMHHKKTDNVAKYSTHTLQKLKSDHELRFSAPTQRYEVPEKAVEGVQDQIARILSDLEIIKSRTENIEEKVNQTNGTVDEMFAFVKANLSVGGDLDQEYDRQLKEIAKLIEAGKVVNALNQLLVIKNGVWERLKEPYRYRILSNIGVCYHHLQDHEKTAEYLIEAYELQPDSEMSLGNIVNAYMAVQNYERANSYLKIYQQKYPDSIAAWALMVKLHSREKDLSGLIKLIPLDLRDNVEIIASLGMAAKRRQNLNEALDHFKKAHALEPTNHFVGQLYLQTGLEILSNDFKLANIRAISNEINSFLNDLLILANQLYEDIKETEYSREKMSLFMAEGYILNLLDRFDESVIAYDRALLLEPDNVFLLKQKGAMYSQRGQKQTALQVFDKIKDRDVAPDLPAIMAETMQNCGRGKEGIQLLEDFIAVAPKSYWRSQSIHILMDLSINERMNEKVSSIRKKFYKEGTVLDHISLSRAAKFLGETDKVKEELNAAINCISNGASYKEKFFLAEELARHKMYNEAITLYEQILVADSDSEPTKKLYRLYHLTGENGKALALLEKIRIANGPTYYSTAFEIELNQTLGNYEAAKVIAEAYTAKFPTNTIAVIGLCGLYLRLGDWTSARNLLSAGINYLTLPTSQIITYVSQLNTLGQKEKGYEVLYEYRRRFDNRDGHITYYHCFFQFPLQKETRSKPEVIGVNTVVTLTDTLNTNFILTIEDRPKNELKENEFNLQSSRFSYLNGHKKGDSVVIDATGKQWTVKEIEDKYFYAYRESQLKCETIYSENNPYRRFHKDQMPDILQEMAEGHAEFYKDFQYTLGLYPRGFISFGLMSEYFKKEPISLWQEMLAHQVGFFASLGVQDQVLQKMKPTLHDKRLCADITALLTLFELNIGEEVVKCFGKLIVSTSTYDLIFDFHEHSRNFRADSSASETASKLLAFADRFTESFFPQKLLEINALNKEASDMLLGKSFSDTMLLCVEKQAVIFSEDMRYREPVEQVHNLPGIWSQSLLCYLLDKGFIDKEFYDLKVIKLGDIYTTHTSFDGQQLLRAYIGGLGIPHGVFDKLVENLSGWRSTSQSSISVVYWFIVLASDKAEISAKTFENLIEELLMTLITDRQVLEVFNIFEELLGQQEALGSTKEKVAIHHNIRSGISDIKITYGIK